MHGWALPLASLLLVGCSGEPPVEPPSVDPAQAIAQAEALAEQQRADQAALDLAGAQGGVSGQGAAIDTEAAPVAVVLVWQGVGNLHKGFFSDPRLTTGLSADLAGTLQPPANVYVRYDSKEFVGSVRVQLLPGTLRLPVRSSGDNVQLSDLAPITRALSSYRSAVANAYDVRVDSFAVGIESFRGTHACIFGVAGTPPPDGSVVSPCVQVDGVQRCGQPGAEGVRFEPDVARIIQSCLDL